MLLCCPLTDFMMMMLRHSRASDRWTQRPSKDVWLDARCHNHGIARHSFGGADDGYPVVARKWFGITGLSYNGPGVNPVAKPFLGMSAQAAPSVPQSVTFLQRNNQSGQTRSVRIDV